MPTRTCQPAWALIADRIIVGSEGDPRRPDGVFVEAGAYHPASDAWRALPPWAHAAPRHRALPLGGKLYVAGGATRQGFGTRRVIEKTMAEADFELCQKYIAESP